MKLKNIIIISFIYVSLITLAQSPCHSVTVSACIDLKTELHIQSGKLKWVHNGVAPGSDPNCPGLITVNDKEWKDWNIPFPLGFNTYSCSVKGTPLLTNEISKLQQFPQEKNNFETIWFFGDPESPGAHRYIVALEFCPLKATSKTLESNQKTEIKKEDETKSNNIKDLQTYSYSILFTSTSNSLTLQAKAELDKVAKTLESSNAIAEITDHRNNESKNKLFEERAFVICNYLISKGVEQKKLHYISYGETKPITTAALKKIEIKIEEK